MDYKLLLGDNMILLDQLEDNSIDAVVCDGPYGLKFMNKKWDYSVPSTDFWTKIYRVLKPGGHILSFGGTRTYHRMVVNCEDAGFEVRDCISWLYGSGFPKSLNVSKQIDKKYGRLNSDIINIKNKLKELYKNSGKSNATIDKECGFKASGYLRTEIRDDDGWGSSLPTVEKWNIIKKVINYDNDDLTSFFEQAEREIIGEGKAGFLENNTIFEIKNEGYGEYDITKSKTEEGKKYEGFGSALKPAQELILLARKPLSEGTIAENVLKWGTGGLNIDGSRISIEGNDDRHAGKRTCNIFDEIKVSGGIDSPEYIPSEQGRFPANIILDEEAAKLLDEQSGISKDTNNASRYFKVVEQDDCRFRYISKVSKKERNLGLIDTTNGHTTVKPIKLLTYLCKLITPPNGIILDPFMGSGSTGIAALLEGFNFIGMEMEPDYMKIAKVRISNWEKYKDLLK